LVGVFVSLLKLTNPASESNVLFIRRSPFWARSVFAGGAQLSSV
jgi:hypothetical protein